MTKWPRCKETLKHKNTLPFIRKPHSECCTFATANKLRWRVKAARFGTEQCRGGRNMPEIRLKPLQGWQNFARNQGITMQGMQNLAWDLVQTFAGVAEACLRFSSDFCRGGKTFPRIEAKKCRGGKSMPEIRLRLLQGLLNLPRDSVQSFTRSKWNEQVSFWKFLDRNNSKMKVGMVWI